MNSIWTEGVYRTTCRGGIPFTPNKLLAVIRSLIVAGATILASNSAMADDELALFTPVDPVQSQEEEAVVKGEKPGVLLESTARVKSLPMEGESAVATYKVVAAAPVEPVAPPSVISVSRLEPIVEKSTEAPVLQVSEPSPRVATPVAREQVQSVKPASIVLVSAPEKVTPPTRDATSDQRFSNRDKPLLPSQAEVTLLLASLQPPPARERVADATRPPGGLLKDAYGQWLGRQENLLSDLEKLPPVPEVTVRSLMLDAVAIAARRSPSISQAHAEWEASQYDVDEARGQRYPQVQLGGSTKSFGAREGDGYSNRGGLNFNMTTAIYDFGHISKTIDSRKDLSRASEHRLASEVDDNAYQVCANMLELAKEKLILEINRVFVLRMQTLVGMLAEIIKVDRGRASELTQAQARLLQAKAAEYSAAARVNDIEINLRKLVGSFVEPLPAALYLQMPVANLDELLGSARYSNEILKADAEAKAAELSAQATQAANMPKLNWLVGKNMMEDSFGNESRWQTSLGVTWNAFQGGSGRASERAAHARANASLQKKEQLLLDSENDLRRAHLDALTNYDRASQYKKLSYESAQVRQMFFEQWYHLGKRTLLDVLITENDHNNNQVAEVTSQYDAYQAVLKMHSAAGTLNQWLR